MPKWIFSFGFGSIDSEDKKKNIERRRTEKLEADSAKEAQGKAWKIMRASMVRWRRSNAILCGVLSSKESGVFLVREPKKGTDRTMVLKAKTPEECFRAYGKKE